MNDDGTFVYAAALYIGFCYFGNYIIDDEKIILNFLFKGGHEPTFSAYYYTSTLSIKTSNILIDNNIVEYSENIGTTIVELRKLNDENSITTYKNLFRNALENWLYLNDPII